MAKSAVKNYPMFGAGQGASRVPGASMATTQTSDTSTVDGQDNIDILVSWSGATPIGTFTIQRSPDQANWFPLDFGSGTAIPISGNSGTHTFPINQLGSPYIQCVYTAISGTGTIKASISTKSLSGGAG